MSMQNLKPNLKEARETKNTLSKVAKLELKISKLDVSVAASKPQSACLVQQPDTCATGTYKPVGAEFTMTDFEEYRQDDDSWYSPHFYTHSNGYKMCLRVDANGNGDDNGTHLSVFVSLMQGEFVDQLKWPFRGKIQIKLVNQEKDRDHVVKTVKFTESIPEKCCQRH